MLQVILKMRWKRANTFLFWLKKNHCFLFTQEGVREHENSSKPCACFQPTTLFCPCPHFSSKEKHILKVMLLSMYVRQASKKIHLNSIINWQQLSLQSLDYNIYLDMAYSKLTEQENRLFFCKYFNTGTSPNEFSRTSLKRVWANNTNNMKKFKYTVAVFHCNICCKLISSLKVDWAMWKFKFYFNLQFNK